MVSRSCAQQAVHYRCNVSWRPLHTEAFLPTDTAAQVTWAAVISGRRQRRCRGGGVVACLWAAVLTLRCQPRLLVLFIFTTKMATESAVAEILWLASAVSAVRAERRPTAPPAGDTRSLHVTAGGSPRGRWAALLHCREIQLSYLIVNLKHSLLSLFVHN